MKRTYFIIIIALLVTLFTVNTSFALRCDSGEGSEGGLISVGDSKIQVLSCCGEPILKETIGYTEPERGDKSIKLKISQWTYGPWHGYYYVLTFTGSTLTEINSVRE